MKDGIRRALVLPHAPSQVWHALAHSDALARWMYPNDFEPRVGHQFTFHVSPNPKVGFDGIVRCEVLECSPPTLLSYSWSGGPLVDTTVTFRLEPFGAGTRVYFSHTGFDLTEEWGETAFRGAEIGWSKMLHQLEESLEAVG